MAKIEMGPEERLVSPIDSGYGRIRGITGIGIEYLRQMEQVLDVKARRAFSSPDYIELQQRHNAVAAELAFLAGKTDYAKHILNYDVRAHVNEVDVMRPH